MAQDSASTITTTILQAVRDEHQTSLALALSAGDLGLLGTAARTRLGFEAAGQAGDLFFHGSMKARSRLRTFFGDEAEAALAADPGLEAFVEGARTPAATKVPDQEHWLRVRAAPGGQQQAHPLFTLPVGTAVTLHVPPRVAAEPQTPPRVKAGVLQAQVLASHARGLVLHLDATGMRKLKGGPADWHELAIGGSRVPILPRRGLSAEQEAAVWARPETLLFDYEGHWEDDGRTVMLLAPMQRNWKGRFPDWERFTMPTCPPGTLVTIQRAAG